MQYFKPYNAGLASEPKAVAKKLAELVNSLDALHQMILEPNTQGMTDKYEYRLKLVEGLKADGWRFGRRMTTKGEKITILPPKR